VDDQLALKARVEQHEKRLTRLEVVAEQTR
jgi:hypothetical protein